MRGVSLTCLILNRLFPPILVIILLKIRHYLKMKTKRNIYFAIFDSHLTYSCIFWAQNINAVNRLVTLQKNAPQIINFKDQLFHSSSLFPENNILKFGDKITIEPIFLSINQSIGKCLSYIMIGLHIQEICIDVKLTGL